MDDRNSFQTSQVADQLGVSVSTVRRLCARYAAHLSEEATPRPGGRRLFNAVDVAILREASRLTNDGASEEEIDQRLAQSVTLPASPTTDLPTPPDTLPQLPTLRIDTTDLIEPLQRLAASQDAQTHALQEHARAMDRLADRLVWIVAALVVLILLTVAAAVGWI